MDLLKTLQPDWWFSAHMHVKFEARVAHESSAAEGPEQIVEAVEANAGKGKEKANPDEIMLDDEEEDVVAPPAPSTTTTGRATNFLALDKCLPKRDFLEV